MAVVGTATALFAGTIALVQNDIKRVLAYSTVSQLGYMFLAMGVGAFGAGIFHLFTHAFFKALLFLGAGAVIHALHDEQDMRHMGGLKRAAGDVLDVPDRLARDCGRAAARGFFSKDEILFYTFYNGHQWLWVVGVITSLLTATYMFRLVFLTFHGERPRCSACTGCTRCTGAEHDGHHGHSGTLTSMTLRPHGACARGSGGRLGGGRVPRRAARTRRPQRVRAVAPTRRSMCLRGRERPAMVDAAACDRRGGERLPSNCL